MWSKRAAFAAGLLLTAALFLAGCGEEEQAADIAPDTAIQAARNPSGEEFAGMKGKVVNWQGEVIEARRTFEDDYVEVATLFVDLDDSVEGADARFQISADDRENYQPGQTVRFTAKIREVQKEDGRPILVLQLREIE
ncbi:MAG: hypothetical protein R3316_11420 [Rhodovibrionaceae bacterium]|nr:hypothetical protein [Rhodovibrionaceae bacterium]